MFPTVLELAGIANPLAGELPGRSFAGSLFWEKTWEEEEVVIFDEYGNIFTAILTGNMNCTI